MPEYQYALCEDGYIRCTNCEAKQSEPHTPECTGGSLLVTPAEYEAMQRGDGGSGG